MISLLVSKRAKDNPQYQQVNAISIKEMAVSDTSLVVAVKVVVVVVAVLTSTTNRIPMPSATCPFQTSMVRTKTSLIKDL